MITSQQYHSEAESKSHRKKKKKQEISQLALDSFAAFQPFIDLFDCGIGHNNSPIHLIPKECWQFYARHKAGERNITYPDGTKFNPYLDIVRNIYSAGHVHQHIEYKAVSYYTSGRKGLGLLYLDVDAHEPWQTDEYRAKAVLERVIRFGYFRASNRGQNGYLKVQYTSLQEFNRVAGYLQGMLKRLFLDLGILCDVEVKGTITEGKSGSLAKLPFTDRYPCYTRDETDSWNYPQLRKFQACPIVNARRIEYLVRQLEPRIDEEKIRAFAEHKRALKSQDTSQKADLPEQTPAIKQQPVLPAPTISVPVLAKGQEWGLPKASPIRATLSTSRLNTNSSALDGDAFARNHCDIKPFVRAFFRQYRRYPTTEETLEWLKTNGRYSGEWEDNEPKRAKWVEQILRFTKQTFDPSKLSNGEKAVHLNPGRFSWWVRQHFGSEMTVHTTNLSGFDPDSMTAPMGKVCIPARFIETFLVVAHFCVSHDPLHNKAVPTNRIKKLWEMVEGGASWNQRYYQLVRDRLHRMGVIRIIDRNHTTGKAWRWESGEAFPEDTWKDEQRKFREKHRLPSGDSGEQIICSRENKVHNTLYQDAPQISPFSGENTLVRPPPWLE